MPKKIAKILFLSLSGVLFLSGAGCSKATPAIPIDTSLNRAPAPTLILPVSQEIQRVVPPTAKQITSAISTSQTPKQKIKNSPPSTNPLSYSAALNIYRNSGYYFQFSSCHGLPGRISIKRGVKFMMDNRDDVARTLAINGKSYYVSSYNFVIAAAPKTAGKFFITCDGGGAATLHVAN